MPTVVVTGANRGIGLQLCKQLAARGDDVIAVCRNPGEDLADLPARVIDGIDVTSGPNVERLRGEIGSATVDVLINNAGILRLDTLDTVDYDVMLEQFQVNTLGPLRIVRALLPNLQAGAKIAIVSSRVGSLADNSSGNNYGYRVSKAAVNMVGMNLHRDLQSRQIAVALLHPGLVATEMTGYSGIEPADAARGLIERIDDLSMHNSGSFWHAEGYELPW